MKYADLISGIDRFGAANVDVCRRFLGVDSRRIRDSVVISPGWAPEKVPGLGHAALISSGALIGSFRVWNVSNGDTEITYIQTGCGAPMIMDALLALGASNCKRIVFVSSVGALDAQMGIGDVVVPEYSVCGDGASRYIASGGLGRDVFGDRAYPDASLLGQLKTATQTVCNENSIRWHVGKTFCTDTIFAQFAHMDHILGTGCNTVDMESAVAFRAAKLIGKPLVALLTVSDNAAADKTLVSGITQEDADNFRVVRREIIPKIIHHLCGVRGCAV